MTWIPIKKLCDIEFVVQASLCSWHQFLLLRSHDHPLTVLSVAHQIHFDVLRIVVLAVLLEHTLGLLQGLQVVHPIAHTRTRRIHAWSRDHACFHHVAVGKYVCSGGLWVSSSRHPIGQVGGIDPYRVFMQSPSWPHVRMGIDKSRGDGFARGIDHFRACSIQSACFAYRFDTVVFDENVSLFDDLIAFHRDDACILKQNTSLWCVLGKENLHLMLNWAVSFFLFKFRLVEAVCFEKSFIGFEQGIDALLVCFSQGISQFHSSLSFCFQCAYTIRIKANLFFLGSFDGVFHKFCSTDIIHPVSIA